MGKYFRFVGWLELIAFVISTIYLSIQVFGSYGNPSWFWTFLLLILFIIVGPAVGLLFLSYGSHLEVEEEKEAKKKAAEQKETHFIDTKPKSSSVEAEKQETKENKKDLIISQLIVSEKFGEESVEQLRTLSEEELLTLLDEAYPNKDEAPTPLRLNDVAIKGETITIKSSTYNMKTARVREIEMTNKTLVFTLFSTKYVIMFINFAEANLLYRTLRENLQQDQ